MEKIIHAELIALKEGEYVMYVFKNLDNNEYLMCTKLPNWQTPEIQLGEKGFLSAEFVLAGQEYFDINSEQLRKYSYNNVYFKNFINESTQVNNSEIVL